MKSEILNLGKSAWDVFTPFIEKSIPLQNYTWDVFDQEWINEYEKYFEQLKSKYSQLDKSSNRKFKQFGGDPANFDWSKFRPLRLSREEDWSDWLLHLIETSGTGMFSKSFKSPTLSLAAPLKCFRELTSKNGRYRADIIINWNDIDYTHLMMNSFLNQIQIILISKLISIH